jgi:hypothetical protein
MTVWQSNFETTQAETRLQEVASFLEERELVAPTSDDMANFARLQKVVRVLQARLANLDPELFHPATWGSITTWLTNLHAQAQAFSQSGSASSITQANAQADEILKALPMGSEVPAKIAAALVKGAQDFQAKAVQLLTGLQEKGALLDQKIAAQDNSTAANLQRLNEELAALGATIEQQKGRLDSSIADFQKQFSQEQAARLAESAAVREKQAAEFTALMKAQETAADEIQQATVAEWDAFKETADNEYKEFLSQMKARHAEVDDIFGAIGSASLAGHFAKTADEDATAANRLRNYALAFMILMIAVGGLTLYQSLEHPDLPWHTFIFRLAVALVIAIPAVYAAQESSRHRRTERLNRKKQIELASIDAYLVKLPPEKQLAIKEKLSEKFFGQPDAPDKDDEVTRHELFNLLSDAVKNLTKGR